MSDENLKYWLGFSIVKGIGPAKVQALLDNFGGLDLAWNGTRNQYQEIGLDKRAIQNIFDARANLDLDAKVKEAKNAGITLICWDSANYPPYLREIPAPPPLLYVLGEILETDKYAVAVVGTRRLTTYGRQVTRKLAEGLVNSGITVVSGLARGIDGIAHKTAVEMNGRTLAVMGSGLDKIYPPEHRQLAGMIKDGRGALISEYALGVPPDGKNFPPRNRIISGLSMGVVVVEAGIKSGALISARFALDQDREVFAVPGQITSPASKGTNKLIQEGAKLVTSIDDVIEELNLRMVMEHRIIERSLPESAEEAAIINTLTQEPLHVDELSRKSGLPSSLLSSTLTMMELKGMVLQVGGMKYALAREPSPEYAVDQSSSNSG